MQALMLVTVVSWIYLGFFLLVAMSEYTVTKKTELVVQAKYVGPEYRNAQVVLSDFQRIQVPRPVFPDDTVIHLIESLGTEPSYCIITQAFGRCYVMLIKCTLPTPDFNTSIYYELEGRCMG